MNCRTLKKQVTNALTTCLVVCFCLCFSTQIAHAETHVKRLTDANIKKFIETTTAITSGRDSRYSSEKIAKYLDTHIHKKARFKSAMAYNIPGFPTQENTMSASKKEYITATLAGATALEEYATDTKIESIDISSDGRKATVRTLGSETGVMPLQTEDDGEAYEVPIEGVSACTQILRISKKDILQMYHADCTTRITFTGDF